MALVKCSECGNQISDKAASCPHCGAPQENVAESNLKQCKTPPSTGSEETLMGRLGIYIKFLVKCGALLLVIYYVAPSFFSSSSETGAGLSESNSSNKVSRPDAATMTPVPAQELTNAYANNGISADQKYKGEWILVDGDVGNIKTDISDDAYVMFDITEHSLDPPKATFINTENDKLVSLSKGQHIRALCIGDGVILGSPLLKECTLVD